MTIKDDLVAAEGGANAINYSEGVILAIQVTGIILISI